jgi:murein DD-endopeptidase MepM/ murein hydrolase activator NlpD
VLKLRDFLRRRDWKLIALFIWVGFGAYLFLRFGGDLRSSSNTFIERWFTDTPARPQLTTHRGKSCPGAPFILPSEGLIGLLWNDPAGPYTFLNPHTGIDIFGDGQPGTVPVYAAYRGYLTRLRDWFSTVAIQHDDPLQPGRTIWTYYTHMAARDGSRSFVSPAFPAGTAGQWVETGTLLGYQGDYSPSQPIGMHLHFSIVLADPNGSIKNETRLGNTVDPSSYLGMPLNIVSAPPRPVRCRATG